MAGPEHHAFVKMVLGKDPLDYEPGVLTARYNALMPIISDIMREGSTSTAMGDACMQFFRQGLRMNASQKSSPVILGYLKKQDPTSIRHAKHLLDAAHDNILEFNRERAATTRGPTFSETAVATADLTDEQLKAAAKAAKAAWDGFLQQHAMLFEIINDYSALKTVAKPFADAWDLYGDTSKFIKSLEAQESVAAMSSVLGPIGPGAVELAMLTEVFGLLLMFTNVVTGLIDFISTTASGKPAMPPEYSKMMDQAGWVDFSLHWCKKSKAKLEAMKGHLASVQKVLSKLAPVGNALHKLLHKG